MYQRGTGGSGGGIRIDACSIAGTGTISADGGAGLAGYVTGGGGGRIAVYPNCAMTLPVQNITATGGQGGIAGYEGQDGTVVVGETVPAAVVGRRLFYNRSVFDGHNAGADASDDNAVALDKWALLPEETAGFNNYSSYSRGINGLMVDVSHLPPPTDPIVASDYFDFQVGNGNGWTQAPAPSSLSIEQGPAWDYNMTIIWPDNAIENQWLRVTVLANEHTGLSTPDVFYFGNAIGEAGNTAANAIVNATDEIMARSFPHGAVDPAAINDPYDYNRDGLVNGTDQIIARSHQTNPLTMLRLITAPAANVGVKGTSSEQSDPLQPSSAEFEWLCRELQQMNNRNTKRTGRAQAAVDWLLTMSW